MLPTTEDAFDAVLGYGSMQPVRGLQHDDQDEDNWCWAACIAIVANLDQCCVADGVLERDNCCDVPSDCNTVLPVGEVKAGWCRFMKGSEAPCPVAFVESSLDEADMRAELEDEERPVEILQGVVEYGGHLLLVVGISDEGEEPVQLLVFDPAEEDEDGGVIRYDYEAMKKSFNWAASWTGLG